ncbi:uncharacterized protein [Amphiura filiformis]|uniref:uncharacterized protein n=1 Tax=Amphiura filiformis TaxID=82378 RepID=UPI003B2288AF
MAVTRNTKRMVGVGVLLYIVVLVKLLSHIDAYFSTLDVTDELKSKLENGDNVIKMVPSKYLQLRSCLNSGTDTVILVLSKWGRFRQRAAIRETWGKDLTLSNSTLNAHIALLFIIEKGDLKLEHHVAEEFKKHRDILIGDFKDVDRKSDVLKVLLGVHWIVDHHCHLSNLVVVTASDEFYINLPLLQQNLQSVLLKTTLLDKFWIGYIREGLKPVRQINSPWFVSYGDYPMSVLPTICTMESGFVFSFGAAKDLHDKFIARKYTILPLLDVFVGVVARDGNWSIWQDESIITNFPQSIDICSAKYQTLTNGFHSPQFLSDIHRYNSTLDMPKQFQQECLDPNLSAVLPSNISNIGLFASMTNYVKNPKDACQSLDLPDQVFLLLLISSKPEHFTRRRVIRETYGKEKIIQNKRVRLLFVLGLSQSNQTNIDVQDEAQMYNDMIIFDFLESHLHLTLKVIGGLKWVTEHCQNAKFMYKGDDDVFVNIDVIVAHLSFDYNTLKQDNIDSKSGDHDRRSIIPKTYINGTMITKVYINDTFRIPKEKLYLGCINLGVVIRDKLSKFYVSEKDYRGKFFPPFQTGGGYVISGDVIPALFNASYSVPFINNDDVYQGILAKKIGVKPIHHDGFMNYHTKPTQQEDIGVGVCQLREQVWTLHGFSDDSLKKLWNIYLNANESCHHTK